MRGHLWRHLCAGGGRQGQSIKPGIKKINKKKVEHEVEQHCLSSPAFEESVRGTDRLSKRVARGSCYLSTHCCRAGVSLILFEYRILILLIEDMHAILFERKMISGAALPKKVDGERLSKIYENSI